MKTYSSSEVNVNFAGLDLAGGRGEDEFLRIEPMAESYETVVGVDGSVTRCQSNDRRVRVTLIVMGSSKTNDILSAIHKGDIETAGGKGIAPFMARDNGGTSLIIEPEAFIVGYPKQAKGKKPGTNEWVIECPSPQMHVGGN